MDIANEHILCIAADTTHHAVFHAARSTVGKRKAQHISEVNTILFRLHNAGSQNVGLAATGRGKYKVVAVGSIYCSQLVGVVCLFFHKISLSVGFVVQC